MATPGRQQTVRLHLLRCCSLFGSHTGGWVAQRGRVARRKQPEAEEQAVPTAAKKANEKPKVTLAASAEAADLRFSRVELGPGALAPATLLACVGGAQAPHKRAELAGLSLKGAWAVQRVARRDEGRRRAKWSCWRPRSRSRSSTRRSRARSRAGWGPAFAVRRLCRWCSSVGTQGTLTAGGFWH